MTTTPRNRPVVGRRVQHTRYRDLGKPGAAKPGIITELFLNQGGQVKIRLDGQRWTMHVPANYQGLTYLDEVVPVPELPMGRFTPFASDQFGFYEKAGVLLAVIGEDGDEYVIVTDDIDKARAAATAYDEEIGVDTDSVDYGRLSPRWAVFEWEPEDAEMPWTVRWGADLEGADHAVRIHHLPA